MTTAAEPDVLNSSLGRLARWPSPAAMAHAESGFDFDGEGRRVRRWRLAPHLKLLSDTLREAALFGDRRIIVAMPPRSGKSLLTSHWFPAWYLSLFPNRRIIMASHTLRLARVFGRSTRDTYGELGGRLAEDGTAADLWYTKEGGSLAVVGVGGSISGFGADVLVIDDPHDVEGASSETERENVALWFHTIASRRLEPGGSIVIVSTRWHEDDLCGRLMRQQPGRWRVLALPAIAEENDVLGRKPGEALWPERFPIEKLEEIREEMTLEHGPRWWSALYQQQPTTPEGAMFRRADLRYWRETEPGIAHVETPSGPRSVLLSRCGWFQCADTAMTTKASSDWTVVATAVLTEDRQIVVVDVDRRRLEVPDLLRHLDTQRARWPHVHWIGVEEAASGIGVLQEAKRLGLPIRPLKADRDKAARATTLAIAAEQGRLHLRADARWLADLERELLSFPHGRHDDQVDALSYVALASARGWGGPIHI